MFPRGLLFFALLVVLSGGLLATSHSASADSDCARRQAASLARAADVSGTGPRINVIGDSYSLGSWPSALPGRVHVDAFAGSGFTRAASRCGASAYADRAAHALRGAPRLVVVEGGLNDYRSSSADIEASARRLLGSLLGTRVVVVGPAQAPARADQVDRVDGVLAKVAGLDYISAKDWNLEFDADRLHLTPAGQQEFGRRVAAALDALSGQAWVRVSARPASPGSAPGGASPTTPYPR